MTKTHYQQIANVLKSCYEKSSEFSSPQETLDNVVYPLTALLKNDNPNFDTEKFLIEVGYTESYAKRFTQYIDKYAEIL